MNYDWDAILHKDVSHLKAYAAVETAVRALLIDRLPDGRVGTTSLVYCLVSPYTSEAAVKRLYKALAALSTRGLSDCVTKGEPVQRRFGTIRPNLWHKPTQATVCAGCGRPL